MISVIIRNRNESKYLKSVLEALSNQDTPCEIILVDNNSKDESRKIALEYKVKIVSIDNFTYGRALNLGFAAASGEICVVLSAHSLPLGTSFLSECAKPFGDARIAAARCVYAGKTADALRWLVPEMLDKTSDFISKGILASGCVVRRSVWQQVKFDENLSAAEDKIWTRDVLNLGYIVVSPIPAFYLYLKSIPSADNVTKNYREIVEIFRQTGQSVGFIKIPIWKMLKNLLYIPVSAALSSVKTEFRKLRLKTQFPK
jgi:rhamnosyltransferase